MSAPQSLFGVHVSPVVNCSEADYSGLPLTLYSHLFCSVRDIIKRQKLEARLFVEPLLESFDCTCSNTTGSLINSIIVISLPVSRQLCRPVQEKD